MTPEQFNEKYKDFLKEGHYGLAIEGEEFVKWLDEKFQEYIKQPGFSYSQIKTKFRSGRFYAEGITEEQQLEVEGKIKELCMSP